MNTGYQGLRECEHGRIPAGLVVVSGNLPSEGGHLTVVCTGFASDCLETLEQIAMQGRDSFIATGGECFDYVPALNANAAHVGLQVVRVMQYASGWSEPVMTFTLGVLKMLSLPHGFVPRPHCINTVAMRILCCKEWYIETG